MAVVVFVRFSGGFLTGFRMISAVCVFAVVWASGSYDFSHAPISGFIHLWVRIGEFLDVCNVVEGASVVRFLMLSLFIFFPHFRERGANWPLFFSWRFVLQGGHG